MARPNKLIQFYLTNMCNSRCRTCNIWHNTVREDLDVEKVIDVIKDFPNADYVFGGGEFTLYKYKNELLRYCDENDINYTVLTNCVSKLLVEDLLRSHNIKNLTISCDGIKHDEIRGREGNLRNICELIQDYRDRIPNIKISYTLSKYNEKFIDEDMEFFKKTLGFDKIYFCIAQSMNLLGQDDWVTPSKKSLEKFYEKYKTMLYDKDQQLLLDLFYNKHIKCDSTNNVHTVYTNGDVVVCQSYLSDYRLGNIYDNSFKNIISIFGGVSKCIYNDKCELVCQRRYDYEDRL